jgi:phosphopentomutase
VERSLGKDTTTGHWEMTGVISQKPLPTYPKGFPKELLDTFSAAVGRGVLCNLPYSGTDVIRDYGEEHLRTGALIVYTSADSVFQIAAHEDIVPIEELYRYCEIARELLKGHHGVGRVIARPFEGEHPFRRTPRRHDYSLLPPAPTMLDVIKESGLDVISVGKISDIFAGQGVTEGHRTGNNDEGMKIALSMTERDFHGLCFVNLVDFDMTFGHRNDVDGYAAALTRFDAWLPEFLSRLGKEDALIITADHGCDPSTPSTDHSREHTPMLLVGGSVKAGVDLGTRVGFCDIAATVLEALGVEQEGVAGKSFWGEVVKEG